MNKILGFLALVVSTVSFASSIVVDPFRNRVFEWKDQNLHQVSKDPLGASVVYFLGQVPASATGTVVATNLLYFFTQDGAVLRSDLESGVTDKLYQSIGRCSPAASYEGCIYSATVRSGVFYFLELQQDGTDTLKSLPVSRGNTAASNVISGIPGPSGPLWVRADGNLGTLPYGLGVVELDIQKSGRSYSEAGKLIQSLNTMGLVAAEGANGQLALFDYTQLAILVPGEEKLRNVFNTTSVAFDSCSGAVWYKDEENNIRVVTDSDRKHILAPNPWGCAVPNAHWSTSQRSPDFGIESVLGFPQGYEEAPSILTWSIGAAGSLELSLADQQIVDSEGIDLVVFENTFRDRRNQNLFREPAKVELQTLSGQWVSTGCDCNQPDPSVCAGMTPTRAGPGSRLLPWSVAAGGFAVDLSSLQISEPVLGVRITDCDKMDPLPPNIRPGKYAGFDLDAIVVNPQSLR